MFLDANCKTSEEIDGKSTYLLNFLQRAETQRGLKCNGLEIISAHAHTESGNLDLARETKEINKILNNNATLKPWCLHQHLN